MMGTTYTDHFEKRLYTVVQVSSLLSLSRSLVFDEIRKGRLKSVKVRGARRIPAEWIDDYVNMLQQETLEAAA